VSTGAKWLKALRSEPTTTTKFEPASKQTLAAYARRLRQADPNLSRAQAERDAQHAEDERFRAHQNNNH
jgi:hypothetical protein